MAAPKLCRANVGSRSEPQQCGEPVANGMRAACRQHATTLIATSEPGIYYRGGGYVVVWRYRGKQHKSFHREWHEAKEARGRRQSGERRAAVKQPFDTYALEWIDAFQGRRAAFDEDTRKQYRRALELYAVPHFGTMRLSDIERDDVKRLVAKLQSKGLAPASISAYLAPVRAMFSELVDDGKLVANPAERLNINKKASGHARDGERVKEMSRQDLAAVVRAVPDSQRLAIEILAATGCRISEALGLEWGDVTFGDRPTVVIRRQWYRGALKQYTKTDAGVRVVELPAGLAARLWELGADATGPILHTRTGRRLSARNVARTLTAAASRAGVPGVTPHSFRHTHGSILLDEGWTIAEVADRLGHADPSITARVYSHKMSDRRRELGFLDSLGNGWATQDPGMAANGSPSREAKTPA